MRKESDAHTLRAIALQDLARSGLDNDDFKLLGLEVITREQAEKLVGESRACYRIPYFDLKGNQTQHSRYRFIENLKGRFAKVEGGHRYSQPANTLPHAYLPPYLDWEKIANNPKVKILITEGEKKAALACKLGIACISIPGAWSFKSAKHDWTLLPELAQIAWKNRDVEICYDSDVMHKAQVRQALSALATELSQHHGPSSISFIFLDADQTENKTALDDFLVSHSAKAFRQLERSPFRQASRIQQLNERVCFVTSQSMFFNIESGKYFKHLGHVREAFMNEGEEVIDGKKTALVIDLWAKSVGRRTVANVIYQPGSPEVTEQNELNLWRPTKVTPVPKKPKRWLEIVDFIMQRGKYAEWFLRWLAYPIQHPGTKLYSSVFVYGKQQGIGKTLIVDPVMEYVYGESNFYRLSNEDLQSSFNSYVARKQFIVTNEIYLSDYKDRRSTMSKMKDIITREKATVNEKFQPKVEIRDYCNYYLSSNHADALVLERGDRRMFVIQAPEEHKLEQSVYDEFDDYLRNGEGAGHILHYLQTLDLDGFNPKADAMVTEWKPEIIDLSADQLSEFVTKLIEEPKSMFMQDGHMPELHLRRAEDLLRMFELKYPHYRFNVTIARMGRALNDPRLEKRKVRMSESEPMTVLYAVIDREHWKSKKNREWAEHYKTNSRLYGGKSRH